MFFVPHVINKKGGTYKVQPFPPPCSPEGGQQFYNGIFTGISVEICNKCDILALYNNGFYGKGQSRSVPNVLLRNASEDDMAYEETLSLGLEEAFFLSFYLKVLKISDLEKKEMKWQDVMDNALKVNDNFLESLASYLYLKSKGWVVKSGLKFAGNYLIYRKGPRFFHASFVVIIVKTPTNTDHLEHKRLKGLQRVAETSGKDVLILDVNKPNDFQMQALEDITQLCIAETVIKRFNYTSFVQQTQRNTS